ncbi:MAG: methionyl-tRNA formyltransferase [candidate division Zixibacteria bacterium]|nr:methionyl-tRNA formyltransferase [candidate division Zixibacteria bacterium]
MKVVFMGTPEFARRILAHLCDSREHSVLAVVTGPEKQAGRGRKLLRTACHEEALERGLTVFTPATLKDHELKLSLTGLGADIFVVAAFRILPPSLFTVPPRGSINIHASLLPAYRGAAPINWAIINGERQTGLTSFFLKESVDTGDVILQQKTAILDDDTFDSLYLRLADQAGPFLLETLDLIEKGESKPAVQDDAKASRAPKITPFDAMIDWGFPAEKVRNFVRGMATKPGAYTYFRGGRVKVLACAVESAKADGTRPGTILADKKKLLIQCDHSVVQILRLVPQGRGEIEGRSFINGFHPRPGELLGERSVATEQA